MDFKGKSAEEIKAMIAEAEEALVELGREAQAEQEAATARRTIDLITTINTAYKELVEIHPAMPENWKFGPRELLRVTPNLRKMAGMQPDA